MAEELERAVDVLTAGALAGRIEEQRKNIEDALIESASYCNSVGDDGRRETDDGQRRLKELIQERRMVRTRSTIPGERSISRISKDIQKDLRAIKRAKKRGAIETALNQAQSLKWVTKTGGMKKRSMLSSVKTKDGSIKHVRQEVADVFADSYSELYASPRATQEFEDTYDAEDAVEPFSFKEVEDEI